MLNSLRFPQFSRHLKLCTSASAKKLSPLAALRKKTGYSLSKCKEALVKYDNDMTLAETWLRDQARIEGWTKADQGRPTQEGVVAALVRGNKAAMIEINCETDFVAKNDRFHNFVSETVETILKRFTVPSSNSLLAVDHLKSTDLLSLGPTVNDHGTIGDLTAENIGLFGENISLTRACYLTAGKGHVGSYVYNAVTINEVAIGRYGSLVHLEHLSDDNTHLDFGLISNQLGQHIVGFNPRLIEPDSTESCSDDEILVRQKFLLNNELTVEAWLKSCDVRVTDFVRYAVGETNELNV